MKLTRIIYKSHLLPPFLTPFNTIKDFMKVIHPGEFDDIINLKDSFKQAKYKEKQKQFQSINDTLMQQLLNFKQNYTLPLKDCPTFYNELHKLVIEQIGVSEYKDNYRQAEKKILKKKAHQRFMRKYSQFRSENVSSIMSTVQLIPAFFYTSPEEMAFNQGNYWQSLEHDQKIKYQFKFGTYLERRHQKLKSLAQEQKISLGELLKLMKNQFNPFLLSQVLKTTLFS